MPHLRRGRGMYSPRAHPAAKGSVVGFSRRVRVLGAFMFRAGIFYGIYHGKILSPQMVGLRRQALQPDELRVSGNDAFMDSGS